MDPDAGLIRRMNQGDDEAIEAFVRKYYPQILGYCCYHLRHRQDGEDVTQETFARFFASLDRYRHYGKAANYLYVIAGNLCRDHLRRRQELPLEDLPQEEAPPADWDTRLDLEAAFRTLPEEIQAVAVLCLLQERKQREAAKILGIGLPLAREIVRQHHGDIRAVQEASGTAFVVTLPALNCVEKTEN